MSTTQDDQRDPRVPGRKGSIVLDTMGRISAVPVLLTPILGRKREITGLRALMRDPDVRLVTITGPGGVGKTRLAIAAISEADDDVDVVFVPLAAIREAERIVPAIVQALGLQPGPNTDDGDALVAALANRPAILVLDNLEQVPDAAPVLSRLSARVPAVTILATSQSTLDMDGEHVFPLGPLPLPADDDEDVMASDAVALFVQRARAVDPSLETRPEAIGVIADICRRLDGLPLAIELAAARANLLSPHALRDRLGDRLGLLGPQRGDVDDRHRTLRAAIAWTYDLLDPVEQAMFRRLSVFEGGLSVDAARVVLDEADDRPVTELLDGLLRRNLLQAASAAGGAERYLMLESLRAFGTDQLGRVGDDHAARLAHARWVVRLAEAAEPHLRGGKQVAWMERLGSESENLRLAIEWSLAAGYHENAARVIAAVWRFFGSRGLMNDALEWMSQVLAPGAVIAPEYRARALIAAGHISLLAHRDRQAGQASMEQALHLAWAIGNKDVEMRASGGLGIFAYDAGDYDRATEHYERFERLARELGSLPDLSAAANNLGLVMWMKGDAGKALAYWEESARINAEIGEPLLEAQILINLGAVQNGLGLLEPARDNLGRAIGILRALNDRTNLVASLINYGDNALLRDDLGEARASYVEAANLGRAFDHEVFVSAAIVGLSAVSIQDGDLAGAASLLLESLMLVGENSEPMRMLEIIEALAALGEAAGENAAAAELLAAAKSLRGDSGTSAPVPGLGDPLEREARVRSALGDEAFDRASAAGAALDMDGVKTRAGIIARRIAGRRVGDPGITWSQPEVVAGEPIPVPDYHLTTREAEILRLLSGGMATQDIAASLSISPRTVTTHVANIMAKMDVTSRTAAVARALRDGVIPGDA